MSQKNSLIKEKMPPTSTKRGFRSARRKKMTKRKLIRKKTKMVIKVNERFQYFCQYVPVHRKRALSRPRNEIIYFVPSPKQN